MNSDKLLEDYKAILTSFLEEGYSDDGENTYKISADTKKASEHFLELFLTFSPDLQIIPTIAPDEDGGLEVTWDLGNDITYVVVDGWALNYGQNICSSPVYKENIEFSAATTSMPEAILSILPRMPVSA